MENRVKNVIDIGQILKLLVRRKKFFFKLWIATFVLSCFWIFPKPRYYDATVVLAPEMAGENADGALSSLASNFGFNLNGSVTDAIYPQLYPDLIASNNFIVSLFDIPVKSIDNEVNCDLYTYLAKKQKVAFYSIPYIKLRHWLRGLLDSNDEMRIAQNDTGKKKDINPFRLSKRQTEIVDALKNSVSCSVDKKTEVFSIRVHAQDPLVAATLADSVSSRLQKFITEYRTSKARIDVAYYTKLVKEAKASYEKTRRLYGSYSDANTDVSLPSLQAKIEDIENDMQLKFNAYTAMNTQLAAANAKLQERTPAFTVLQSPTVPIKPTGPKRMLFVFAMLLLSTICGILWLMRDKLSLYYDSKP